MSWNMGERATEKLEILLQSEEEQVALVEAMEELVRNVLREKVDIKRWLSWTWIMFAFSIFF